MSSIHTRVALDEGLTHLETEIRQLSSLVDVAIERSLRALSGLDQGLAVEAIEGDRSVNELRFQIEDRAINLIALQQPLAGDLRFIVAALMTVTELERMGDYAAGIARIVQLHGDKPLLRPLVVLPEMGRIVREMLREAIDAFLRRDDELARRVAARDDEVDLLYERVYEELIDQMVREPSTLDRATWLLWAAHNLERLADRVQNICERTMYEVAGRVPDLSPNDHTGSRMD